MYTIYVLAERKTQNINAEIVGLAYVHNNYNVITYIKNHHFDTNLKGLANMRVYTVNLVTDIECDFAKIYFCPSKYVFINNAPGIPSKSTQST